MNIPVDIAWPLQVEPQAVRPRALPRPGRRLSMWLWTREWWPPGCWLNGRVWLCKERCLGWMRLPVRWGGWRTDRFLREPAAHLPRLLALLAVCGALRLLPLMLNVLTVGS